MNGKVVWRTDLKPVGREEVEQALNYEWAREIQVNPRNYDRISGLMPAKTKVVLIAHPGVSLCEIQVYDDIPIPKIDWNMPEIAQKSEKPSKDRIPVAIIKDMLNKGSSAKEIRTLFSEAHQTISSSQIKAIEENRTKRKYISVKKTKNIEKKVTKEKSEPKRRTIEKVGTPGARDIAPNEGKARRIRRSSTRVKDRNTKSRRKV